MIFSEDGLEFRHKTVVVDERELDKFEMTGSESVCHNGIKTLCNVASFFFSKDPLGKGFIQ